MSKYIIRDDKSFEENLTEFLSILEDQDPELTKGLREVISEGQFSNDGQLRKKAFDTLMSCLDERESD